MDSADALVIEEPLNHYGMDLREVSPNYLSIRATSPYSGHHCKSCDTFLFLQPTGFTTFGRLADVNMRNEALWDLRFRIRARIFAVGEVISSLRPHGTAVFRVVRYLPTPTRS